MGVRLGLDAKLFRNAATYNTPNWQELKNVKDLTLNVEAGEADASTRGNGGWRAILATLKDGSIEFERHCRNDCRGATSPLTSNELLACRFIRPRRSGTRPTAGSPPSRTRSSTVRRSSSPPSTAPSTSPARRG
uniref:Uncharacterized protein n=1 Tax=Schlesneria paludicola TaxID=360056 RepID=A0A7C4QRL3_9PLAN